MEDNIIKNRILSFKYAFKGAYLLIKKETSIKIHITLAIIACIMGFYFGITKTEWMIQLLTIALVISTEGLNTAVEEIANFMHPEQHSKIGYIKDIAAGAVFFTALVALIIGLIIYLPYLY